MIIQEENELIKPKLNPENIVLNSNVINSESKLRVDNEESK